MHDFWNYEKDWNADFAGSMNCAVTQLDIESRVWRGQDFTPLMPRVND